MKKVVYEICRYIEGHVNEPLTLFVVAKKSDYSPAYLQRRFTEIVGSSPKSYQAAIWTQQFKQNLKRKERLAGAVYSAGYGSPSRVYEKLEKTFGMTPKQYQNGAKGLEIFYAQCRTKLGQILIAATERGICCLQFADGSGSLKKRLELEFPNAVILKMPEKSIPLLKEWMTRLNSYLTGKSKLLELPLDIRGTAFQMLVWRYLQTIPSGEVHSYSEVAKAIGNSKAARAVASACARNRVALVIPCHRVIRGDGALSGYRWGPKRKRALLNLENRPA